MANTVTSLIPDIYAALDIVSNEPVGFINAVTRDSRADRVALNQTLRSFSTAANTAGRTRTPAMAFPVAAYQTIGNKSLTISRSKVYPFSWTGEEEYSLNSSGPGADPIRIDQIAQCFRAARNDIELDLATALLNNASRACGTAGTTPFATTLDGTALAGQILIDNGAPDNDRQLVINTAAGAKLRTLMQLTRVNEAGTSSVLTDGVLLNVNRFAMRESGQITAFTKGTGTNYVNDGALAVGVTSIPIDVGSGTVLAGDVVTFAGDTNKYVVTTGVAAAGTIVIAAPGLRVALADDTAMTIGGNYTPNYAFTRNAVCLATRLPATPKGGDLATLRDAITDPKTGLVFEYAIFPGYGMTTIEIGLNWGYTVIKPEHVALLLG